MSAINQKDYLKKYLKIGKGSGEKKKKKKAEKTVSKGLKIIDDDADTALSREIQDDLDAANEDAPQIVAIIDERPPSLRLDEEKNSLWQPIGQATSASTFQNFKIGSIKLNKNKEQSLDRRKERFIDKRKDYSPSRKKGQEYSPVKHNDNSPLRHEKDTDHSPRRKQKYDYSPPRKHNNNDQSSHERKGSDRSPSRKGGHDPRRGENDSSPPRQKGRDQSPPRRRGDDQSPPRRRGDDQSPPRKWDNDSSPPRRKERDHSSPRRRDNDQSSPRKRGDDQSPPRRYKNDQSPPRRKDSSESPSRRREDDQSPPRKRKNLSLREKEVGDYCSPKKNRNKGEDQSPPRKREIDQPLKRVQEDDHSPPRKKRNSSPSPTRKQGKDHSTMKKSKKSRWGEEESNSSPGKVEKPDTTMSGKKAGLQNAKNLVADIIRIQNEEAEMFKSMSTDVSGATAATVRRKRKPEEEPDPEKEKREKELKEKYCRWGKGVKQVQDESERMADQLKEMNKPLARYVDDEDLEKYLKDQEREGDPMLAYIRKKKKKVTVEQGIPEKPTYMGDFMPNRFAVRPGYRWDGVDRSNGYEQKWVEAQNSRKAMQEEAMQWSQEDM